MVWCTMQHGMEHHAEWHGAPCSMAWRTMQHGMVHHAAWHGAPCRMAWCTMQHGMAHHAAWHGAPCSMAWCTMQHGMVHHAAWHGAQCSMAWCTMQHGLEHHAHGMSPCSMAWCTMQHGMVHNAAWHGAQCSMAWSTMQHGMVHHAAWHGAPCSMVWCTMQHGMVHNAAWLGAPCSMAWCTMQHGLEHHAAWHGAQCSMAWSTMQHGMEHRLRYRSFTGSSCVSQVFMTSTLMTNMVGPCFSIIFSPFLLGLGTSSATVGWLISILQLVWNATGFVIGPLVEVFGWRKVALVSAITASCSLIISTFATSVIYLLFSFSIFGGEAGCGVLTNLCFFIIPHYFTRRRGLANACLMAGIYVGQMLGPIIIGYLQQEFGSTCATFLLGAVVLHGCVGACLFHPFQSQRKNDASVKGEDSIAASGATSTENESRCKLLRNIAANLLILKSPRAIIIVVGGALVMNSLFNFLVFMPFAVQAAGHSNQAAGLCMTASASCALLTCIIVSTLTDWPRFSMRCCYMISLSVITAGIIAFSVVEDIRWKTVIMGVWGSGGGGFLGIYNLIVVHYMGFHYMTATMGTMLLLTGVAFVIIGPSIGMIRDVSGSYAVSMWALAGLPTITFILWIFMPAAVRYDRSKSNNM
nr:monocarboxylate transporter 2-like [Cherax quadricarinatus]